MLRLYKGHEQRGYRVWELFAKQILCLGFDFVLSQERVEKREFLEIKGIATCEPICKERKRYFWGSRTDDFFWRSENFVNQGDHDMIYREAVLIFWGTKEERILF